MGHRQFLTTLDNLGEVSWVILGNNVNVPEIMICDRVIVCNVKHSQNMWVDKGSLYLDFSKDTFCIDLVIYLVQFLDGDLNHYFFHVNTLLPLLSVSYATTTCPYAPKPTILWILYLGPGLNVIPPNCCIYKKFNVLLNGSTYKKVIGYELL